MLAFGNKNLSVDTYKGWERTSDNVYEFRGLPGHLTLTCFVNPGVTSVSAKIRLYDCQHLYRPSGLVEELDLTVGIDDGLRKILSKAEAIATTYINRVQTSTSLYWNKP